MTADSANRFIRIRKMMPDIAFADRAEQRIGNGMAEDVGIGMSLQSAVVRNLDAAENQFAALRQPMRVVTNAAANHAHHNFKSITPFDATMLYLSFMSVRGFISTAPPAVSTRIQPAAMSQRLIPCSM